MKESHLVNQILDYLKYRNHIVDRTNSGVIPMTGKGGKKRIVKLAKAGTSDITGCLGKSFTDKNGKERVAGLFLAIECKIGRNKPTELQQEYLDKIDKAGGVAFVAWDLQDVIDFGL